MAGVVDRAPLLARLHSWAVRRNASNGLALASLLAQCDGPAARRLTVGAFDGRRRMLLCAAWQPPAGQRAGLLCTANMAGQGSDRARALVERPRSQVTTPRLATYWWRGASL
jgi:hypothetical protein